MKFSNLVGETFTDIILESINSGDDEIIFKTESRRFFKMYHEPDCCEDVYVDDICGDLQDIIGSPILYAEEVINKSGADDINDSFTWTFYKLSTIKGSVTIKWYGQSNGYYSEEVCLYEITEESNGNTS